MVSRTVRVARSSRTPLRPETASHVFVCGVPLVVLLAGLSAEFLDFRALRVPLLLLVGVGVLATSWAFFGRHARVRELLLTVLIGAATWAAAEGIYVVLHVARGETFDAERFGAQWSQGLALIGVHAAFLGVPTGIIAAAVLLAARIYYAANRRARA